MREKTKTSLEQMIYTERKDGLFEQRVGNTVMEGGKIKVGEVTGLYRRIIIPRAPGKDTSPEDRKKWEDALDATAADSSVLFQLPGPMGIPEFVYAEPVEEPAEEEE